MTKPIFSLPVPQPGQTTKQLLDAENNRVINELYPLNVEGAQQIVDTINSANQGRQYTTRAEFVADDTYAPADGTVVTAGGLQYVRSAGATAIADLPGWLPFGLVFADHLAENTIPGTTDMTAAIIAGWEYTPNLRLRPASYRIAGEVRTYARNGRTLNGVFGFTRLLIAGGAFNVLNFYTGEVSGGGVPLACREVHLKNLIFENVGADRTAGAYITSEERIIGFTLTDVFMDNPFDGLVCRASAAFVATRLTIQASARTTQGGTQITFTSDAAAGAYNPDQSAEGAKCTDMFFYGLELNTKGPMQNPFARSLFFGCADGIYFIGGHVRGGQNGAVFETALLPNRTVISSVDLTSVYFDNVTGSHVIFQGYGNDHAFTPAGATTEQLVKFRDIKFNSARFRAAGGANGSVVAGMTAGHVHRVKFEGGTIRDAVASGIRSATAGRGLKYLTVQGVTFENNNRGNSDQHGDITVQADGHSVQNNTCIGGGALGYGIRLIADTTGSIASGNNLKASTALNKYAGLSGVAVYGNPGFRQINEGTAIIASGTTEVVVNHGLDVTPNSPDIRLTVGDAMVGGVTRFGLKPGSVTATQFTIETNAAPTANFRVYWKVDAQTYE